MALSSDVLYDFVKMTKDDNKSANKESIVYGTAVKSDGSTYVKLDGSDILTPVSATATVNDGERVTVMIKNHSAIITGNFTSPSARSGDVDDLSKEVAYAKTLIADKVSTAELDAQIARIDKLVSDTADIGDIKADNVTITGDLTAVKADIQTLKTKDTEVTGELTAVKADISDLETKKLSATDADLKYANIDFSNIGEAAMEYFYANSGLIKNVSIGDATITGELIGVTIKGGLIEGGTVVADKLVLKGDDGLYYKLNTDGVKTETEQTEYNSLNGSIITANSITATKISVDDLVAFDATIAGFEITEKAIYSGVKSTVDNTTRGIYLDKDGQVAFGDSNNFIKFYKDSDGNYKLAITADSILFGASKKSVEETINDTFGGAYYGPRVYEGTIAQSECLDGQGIRVVSTLLPIQNGTGDPYPIGGGKNLINVPDKTQTVATYLYKYYALDRQLPAGVYTFSCKHDIPDELGWWARFEDAEGNTVGTTGTLLGTANTRTIELTGIASTITIYVNSAVTMTDIQLEAGSTATEYEPPENIRPITGRDALNPNHTGKNLLSLPYVHGGAGSTRTHNGVVFAVNDDGSITVNGTVEGDRAIYIVNRINLGNQSIAPGGTNGTYALSEKLRYNAGAKNCSLELLVGTTWDNVTFYPQIELGAVATEFEPPRGSLHTIQFGQTVYGGSYDSFTGKLISEWGIYTVTGNESWRWHETLQRWETGSMNVGNTCTGGAAGCLDVVCSHSKTAKAANNPGVWVYSSSDSTIALRWKMENNPFSNVDEFKAWLATQHIQFVYKLAVPIEIQLAPQSLVSFSGINTVYTDADGGRIEFGHASLETLGGASSQELDSVFRVTEQISQKQAETNTVTEKLSTALEVDQKGTHIFSPGYKNQNEVLVDSDSVDILVGGEVYSSYIPKGLMLGDYMLWQPEEIGGLAFNLIKR